MEVDDEMEAESIQETESETSIGAIDREEQQDMIEHYTTPMLQKIVSEPYASAPEIMELLKRVGPFENKQTIIQVFGGREMLRKTFRRMNIVRRAVLEGTLGDLFLEMRVQPGEIVGDMIPGIERFIESWAPWRTEGERYHELGLQMEHDYLFEEDPIYNDNAPPIDRYPHTGEDTEDYLRDAASETDMEWEVLE